MFLQKLKQLFTKTEVRLINPEDPLAPYLRVQCSLIFEDRMRSAKSYINDAINYGMDDSGFKVGKNPSRYPYLTEAQARELKEIYERLGAFMDSLPDPREA